MYLHGVKQEKSTLMSLMVVVVVVVVVFSTVDKFHVYIVGIRHYITFHYTLVLFCVSCYSLLLFGVNISNFNIRQMHCNLSTIIRASFRQFVLRHYVRTLGYTVANSTLIPLNKCLHIPRIFSLYYSKFVPVLIITLQATKTYGGGINLQLQVLTVGTRWR